MKLRKLCVAMSVLATTLIAGTPAVFAENSAPMPMPADNKLVVFVYDANNTFQVLTLPNFVTHIKLADDEQLVMKPALGDTVQWLMSGNERNLFVKPLQPNISTSMTLVTSQRSYQIMLHASPMGGKWFQRVSWEYPEVSLRLKEQAAAVAKAEKGRNDFLEAQVVSRSASPTSMNFNYQVDGDAKFKPMQVFDDGKFTYFRIPKVAELPAVFMVNQDGPALVNFTVQGDYLVVQRMADEFMLKLGDEKITVVAGKKSFFGSLFGGR